MNNDSFFTLTDSIFCLRVGLGSEFCYNSFLLLDEEPALIHTGRVKLFDRTLALAQQVMDPSRIKHIAFSHFEADECGALNQWLGVAREAVPLVPAIGRASIEDFSIVPPRCIHDGERIELGRLTLQALITPHCPHGWDACLFYEPSNKILFSSDVGAQPGVGEAITERDPSDEIVTFQRQFGFLSEGQDFLRSLSRLLDLPIDILATQHGSLLRGQSVSLALKALEANARDESNALRDRVSVSCTEF